MIARVAAGPGPRDPGDDDSKSRTPPPLAVARRSAHGEVTGAPRAALAAPLVPRYLDRLAARRERITGVSGSLGSTYCGSDLRGGRCPGGNRSTSPKRSTHSSTVSP